MRWFPLQRDMAEWAGDTRFTKQHRRLIDDAQLAAFRAKLEPGDIILERRNWYISNIGLPGFLAARRAVRRLPGANPGGAREEPEVKPHLRRLWARISLSWHPKAGQSSPSATRAATSTA